MGLDYCTGQLLGSGTVLHGAIINGTYQPLDTTGISWYRGSKTYLWLPLLLQVRIATAATSDRTHKCILQMDEDGTNDFTSPIELASVAIATTDAAGAFLTARVPAAKTGFSGYVPAGRLVRVIHTANNTDASLDYQFEVFATNRHD